MAENCSSCTKKLSCRECFKMLYKCTLATIMKWVILALFFSFVLFCFIHFISTEFATYFYSNHDSRTGNMEEAHVIYYSLISVITFGIVFFASIQVSSIIKQRKDNLKLQETRMLLEIDKRWCSNEIIQARCAIHKIYLKVKKYHCHCNELDAGLKEDTNNFCCNLIYPDIEYKVGQEILKLSRDESGVAICDFIYILNLLDFMETIGFLYSQKSISLEKLSELLGNSIIKFYEYFRAYINKRQARDPYFYKHYINLYNQMYNERQKNAEQ